MDSSIERDAQILATQSYALEETSPNVNTSILRLTPALRRRIYMDPWMGILVRLPSWHDEKYAVLNLNGGNYEPSHYHYNPTYKLGIYGLLVCCRTIYAEVSALLYSSNRFVIRYWEKQSLSPLRALTPSSLSSLTNLKIVLNQASCHFRDFRYAEDPQGVCCVNKNVSRPGLHDASLDLREARAKALVDEWKSAAEHLARYISPHKLELCVVCNVRQDDLESATKVLKPLSLFSELHNCHIRLSRNPSPQLQRMAHNMVLKSQGLLLPDELEKTSQTKPQIGSHLLALPRELRLYILSYTDLITPWKEVEWSRDCNGNGKYIALYPRCRAVEGLYCDSHLHYGCRFFNCWPAHSLLSKAGIGCFCQVRHSAASSTCICWAPPTALFLVNRTLLNDAQAVFFSGNRFVVHDFRIFDPWSRPCDPWSRPSDPTREEAWDDGEGGTEIQGPGTFEYHSDQFAASIFLRNKVPKNMLRELRELEFVFPPYIHTGWPGEGHRALADWAETLHWARDKLNLPGLRIQLVMADSLDVSCERYPPGREHITSEQVEAILSAYRRIASPISILAQAGSGDKGATKLRGFYARVAWPWHWNWGYEEKLEEYGWRWVKDYSRDRLQELREETERLVLGHRDNEAYVSSREPPWNSIWEDRFALVY